MGRDFVVRGSAGNDNVAIDSVRTGGYWLIDSGAGNDILWMRSSSAVGGAAVLAGLGGDYLGIKNFSCGASLYVDMAAGFDLVNIAYCAIGQTLAVSLGDDSDQLTVAVSRAKTLSIDAGLGYDAVRVESSAMDQIFAVLGDGGDSMALITSLARVERLPRRRARLQPVAHAGQRAHRLGVLQLSVGGITPSLSLAGNQRRAVVSAARRCRGFGRCLRGTRNSAILPCASIANPPSHPIR